MKGVSHTHTIHACQQTGVCVVCYVPKSFIHLNLNSVVCEVERERAWWRWRWRYTEYVCELFNDNKWRLNVVLTDVATAPACRLDRSSYRAIEWMRIFPDFHSNAKITHAVRFSGLPSLQGLIGEVGEMSEKRRSNGFTSIVEITHYLHTHIQFSLRAFRSGAIFLLASNISLKAYIILASRCDSKRVKINDIGTRHHQRDNHLRSPTKHTNQQNAHKKPKHILIRYGIETDTERSMQKMMKHRCEQILTRRSSVDDVAVHVDGLLACASVVWKIHFHTDQTENYENTRNAHTLANRDVENLLCG